MRETHAQCVRVGVPVLDSCHRNRTEGTDKIDGTGKTSKKCTY